MKKTQDNYLVLAEFLRTTWAPDGLASDGRGNSLPLKSPLATHYSIGGAVQLLFKGTAAPAMMTTLCASLDAREGRCVLTWECEPGRDVYDVLDLIELAGRVQRGGIIRALGLRSDESMVRATLDRAKTQVRALWANIQAERLAPMRMAA